VADVLAAALLAWAGYWTLLDAQLAGTCDGYEGRPEAVRELNTLCSYHGSAVAVVACNVLLLLLSFALACRAVCCTLESYVDALVVAAAPPAEP